MPVLAGLLIILHGLVHLWYVVLSRGLVPFQPEMGWTGHSWALTGLLGDTTTRALAAILHVLAAVGLVAAGVGILGQQDWARGVLMGAALGSALVILLFWDGSPQMPVQKGLIGLLLDIGILLVLLLRLDTPGG